MNTVCINNQPLQAKEWQGRRVVTLTDVDSVHQRPAGTAGRNFRKNKKHFIANVDYFSLSKKELPTNFVANSNKRGNPNLMVILLTETGYLMLVKSFTDDLAWRVQRELVNNYFRAKEPVQQRLPEVIDEPVRKTWCGTPVMTTKDLAYFLGCQRDAAHHLAKEMGTLLEGAHMYAFKRENGIRDSSSRTLVFHEPAVESILRRCGLYEANKDFLRSYFEPSHRADLSDDEMRLAIQQADLLYQIAKEIRDPAVKEMNLKAVTALLMNVGLWGEAHAGYNGVSAEWGINSTEGWNKSGVLRDAKRYWPKK